MTQNNSATINQCPSIQLGQLRKCLENTHNTQSGHFRNYLANIQSLLRQIFLVFILFCFLFFFWKLLVKNSGSLCIWKVAERKNNHICITIQVSTVEYSTLLIAGCIFPQHYVTFWSGNPLRQGELIGLALQRHFTKKLSQHERAMC